MGSGPPGCGQPPGQHPVCCILLADDSSHLTDGLHTADQILLHRHVQIPPKIKVVLGRGLRTVGSPRMVQKLFAVLLAETQAHLTDGLHTADQVLLHIHSCFPPNSNNLIYLLIWPA